MKNKKGKEQQGWKIKYTYILWMGEKTNLFGEKKMKVIRKISFYLNRFISFLLCNLLRNSK